MKSFYKCSVTASDFEINSYKEYVKTLPLGCEVCLLEDIVCIGLNTSNVYNGKVSIYKRKDGVILEWFVDPNHGFMMRGEKVFSIGIKNKIA